MGRAIRIHLPGSAFHVVARTQGHEDWFVDALKARIADMLLTAVTSVGARPVAFCVMDNHFHLVMFQGHASLGETLQPAMRRIALLVQKQHGLTGHVFERRYRSKVCQDAEHLPNAILYVHRNPVAAKICTNPTDYQWSSARIYEGTAPPGLIAVEDGLRVFDSTNGASIDASREAYRARLKKSRVEDMDAYWSWFCSRVRRRQGAVQPYIPFSPHNQRAALRDLRDVALHVLRSIDDGVSSEIVRSRYGGAAVVRIRSQLIAALSQRGYSGVDIARYLRISEATVSRIRSALRWSSISMSGSAGIEDGKQVR